MKKMSIQACQTGDLDKPTLNRLAKAVGVSPENWPTYNGVLMQPVLTLDLDTVELDVPNARGKRAMVVFADSRYESDLDSKNGYAVRWVTEEETQKYSTPPPSYVDEPLGEYASDYDAFELETVDYDLGYNDNFLGGAPDFDGRTPTETPEGAFVLQMNYDIFVTRAQSVLYVYEGGCYVQKMYEDDEVLPNWADAIASSFEFVVTDAPPAEGAIQKWGGVPVGVAPWDYPDNMTHLFTYEWDDFEEWVEDGVAIAVFTKLKKDANWGDQPGFFETREITKESIQEAADDTSDPPGTILPEKSLELRPFPEGTTWRDLKTRSFVGPREALVKPDVEFGGYPGRKMQLTHQMLPNAPGEGVLYFADEGSFPWWVPTSAPTTVKEVYYPKGTLYNDVTTAAVVGGYLVDFEGGQVELEALEMLDKRVSELNEKNGWALTLFVPGDSTTDPDSSMYGGVVIGMPLHMTSAWDGSPTAFDPKTFATRWANLPVLSADDIEFIKGCETVEIESVGESKAHLLSWGPLCYAAIHVGVAMEETDRDSAIYKYAANQDMEQMWSPGGIDGVHLQSAEFSDVSSFDFSNSAIEANLAKVPELTNPMFFLLCRYD